MKCVKNTATGEIKRATNDNAAAMVAKGWAYCGKELWKATSRTKKPEVAIKSGKEDEPAQPDESLKPKKKRRQKA